MMFVCSHVCNIISIARVLMGKVLATVATTINDSSSGIDTFVDYYQPISAADQ